VRDQNEVVIFHIVWDYAIIDYTTSIGSKKFYNAIGVEGTVSIPEKVNLHRNMRKDALDMFALISKGSFEPYAI
jgi:hypothetical protein